MDLQLHLYSTSGTSYGTVQLEGNEAINITMSIASIKSPSERSAPYTQSFILPGNEVNNKLFNFIFNIGADSLFDTKKKVPCALVLNSIPVLQHGTFQLTDISIDDNGKILYMVTIFGEVQDLYSQMGDKLLTDLDWSELNHIWTYSAVTASWTGTTYPEYFYPLVDYGYDFNLYDMSAGGGVTISQMFPAIQFKKVVDKIFSASNKTYQSAFFNSNYYKNLYLPFNGSVENGNDDAFVNNLQYRAQMTSGYGEDNILLPAATLGPYSTTNINIAPRIIPNDNDSTPPNFDNGANYNIGTYKYTAANASIQQFFQNVAVFFNYTGPPPNVQITGSFIVHFHRSSYISGTTPYYSTSINYSTFSSSVTNVQLMQTPILDDLSSYELYPCQVGEEFWATFEWDLEARNFGPAVTINLALSPTIGGSPSDTYGYNKAFPAFTPGQLLDYNQLIPKNIKQKDIIDAVTFMHNLYFDTTENGKILVEPRTDYYNNDTTVLYWDSKLDEKVPIKERLISELQVREIDFTYTPDKDYYNEKYTRITNTIFGEQKFDIGNEYNVGVKTIQPIFSPTPSIAVKDSSITSSYANEFVIPVIGKVDSNGVFGRTDSNVRILQRNRLGVLPLATQNYWYLDGVLQKAYPYLGMLSHPSNPVGATDIGFGTVDMVFYDLTGITQNSLVNTYWQDYLEQLSDKDSKIITANFHLTADDINRFRFSNSVYMETLTDDGGHYFIVNKISYSPTSTGSHQVELIKMKKKFITHNTVRPLIHTMTATDNLNIIELGGGTTLSTGSVAIGRGSVIGAGSPRSFVMGENSTINGGSPRSMVIGSGSTVAPGAIGAVVFGDNISASTGNALFTNNIVISSGGTINGSPISGLTGGPFLPLSGGSMDSLAVIKSANGGGQIDLDWFGTPGDVFISNDNGGAADAFLYLTNSGTSRFYATAGNIVLNAAGSVGMVGYGNDAINLNLSDITIGMGFGSDDIKVADVTTFTSATPPFAPQNPVFISAEASFIPTGITNSAIIGTQGITATTSNTTYVENLVVGGTLTATGGTNPVLVRAYVPNAYSVLGTSTLSLSGVSYDTTGSYSASSSTFIVPVDGYYEVNLNMRIQQTAGALPFLYVGLRKNGAVLDSSIQELSSSLEFRSIILTDIVQCVAGDYLDIEVTSSAIFNIGDRPSTTDLSWITYKKL